MLKQYTTTTKSSLRLLFLLFILLSSHNFLLAQVNGDSSTQIQVEIQVIRLANQGFESGPNRSLASYRFFLIDSFQNQTLSANGQDCLLSGINGRFWQNPSIRLERFPLIMNRGQSSFQIEFRTHNERKNGSDFCSANSDGITRDKHRASSTWTFNLEDFEPGVFSSPIQLLNGSINGRYAEALIQIRYSIPTPSYAPLPIQLFCTNEEFNIQAGLPALPQNRLGSISYQLEYAFLNEASTRENPEKEVCYFLCEEQFGEGGGQPDPNKLATCQLECNNLHPPIIEYVWYSLGNSLDGQFSAIPFRDLSLDTLSQNTSVLFRLKAFSPELSSPYTNSHIIDFSPSVPQVSQMAKTRSCPNVDNAQLKLLDFSFPPLSQSLAFALYDVHDTIPSPFGRLPIKSGLTYGPDWLIDSLPPGQFELGLAYPQNNVGVCSSLLAITIEAYPNLSLINSPNIRPLSCPGSSDGQISISASGGEPPYTYSLLNEQSQLISQNNTGNFLDLAAGEYQFEVQDQCNQILAQTAVIPEIILPSIHTESKTSTCLNPGNGEITLTIRDGSGMFSTQLFLEGTLIREAYAQKEDIFTFTGLSPGMYTINVWDHLHPLCDTVSEQIVVNALAPLSFDSIAIQHPDCFSSQNGAIHLFSSSSQRSIQYLLKNLDNQSVYQNSHGSFDRLASGKYLASLKSNIGACLDVSYSPDTIHLSQPEQISISFTTKDLRCSQANTGSLQAKISGGSPPYNLIWERDSPLGWISLPSQDSALYSLEAGNYRLKIRDQNNCSSISPIQTILSPDPLVITSIDFHRDDCSDLLTRIDPQTQGGSGPYRYFIRRTDSDEFQSFKPQDKLSNGSFILLVMDQENCQYTYSQIIELNTQQLFFKLNIDSTCQEDSNGTVVIQALGGSPPYQYSLDGGAHFQKDSVFENLSKGNYHLIIRDQTGCEAQQNIFIPEKTLNPQANFLISTVNYSLDTLALIEISNPQPDSMHWVLDSSLKIIEKSPERTLVVVQSPGIYQIGLRARFQNCWKEIYKTLTINPFDSSRTQNNPFGPEPNIKNLGIYPNPNPGTFRCALELNRKEEVTIRIRHVAGKRIYERRWAARFSLDEVIKLIGTESGTYFLEVITEHELLVQRFIIQ